MQPNNVRVAVIGAGNMGRHHVRNYHEMNGVRLAAIADADPASAALAKQYEVPFYESYQEMIKHEQPTAVSVVVPTPFHHEVASFALQNGADVLVEKPIAATVAEAHQLESLAQQFGRILTVGHIERFNPAVLHLKQLIASGRLGEISAMVCRRVGGFPQREPKTDVIVDLAIHDIDIMADLMGEVPQLVAAHGSRTFHSQRIDSAEILLRYGVAAGFVQTNWVTPVKIRTISITGSKGYVEANYITQEVELYEHTAVRSQDNFPDFVRELGTPQVIREKIKLIEPLRQELNLFIEAVKTRDESHIVKPADATTALAIALAAAREAQQ